MAPTPVKTTPASATKKRRRPSHSSTPRASTSQTTLDSLAPAQSASAKKAKKVKRTEEEQAQEQDEGEDKRFSAFLDEDDVEQGSLDAGEDEEELRELRELDVDLDEAGEAIGEADDRFASFPTEDDDVELSERELLERTTLPAHLLPRSAVATKAGKQAKTPGLIYLSRIPPGMGPGKVKHLLSQFGEVGRIYLARADAGKGTSSPPCFSSCSILIFPSTFLSLLFFPPVSRLLSSLSPFLSFSHLTEISAAKRYKQKERHQSHNFKEGWVEYMDKRVARSVAEMLNANPIGKALTMGGTRCTFRTSGVQRNALLTLFAFVGNRG